MSADGRLTISLDGKPHSLDAGELTQGVDHRIDGKLLAPAATPVIMDDFCAQVHLTNALVDRKALDFSPPGQRPQSDARRGALDELVLSPGGKS